MTAGRSVNSLSQNWGTPRKYVDAVKEVFGGEIELDPCSNDFSIVAAKIEYRLPHNDGLVESWNYETIFVNPPYGSETGSGRSIKNWIAHCAHASVEYGSEVLALIPVAVNTAHWKQYVFGRAAGICFFYDTRLRFLENGKDVGKGAPMACAMIYWGRHFERFYNVFIRHGAVVDTRPLIGEQIGPERDNLPMFGEAVQITGRSTY